MLRGLTVSQSVKTVPISNGSCHPVPATAEINAATAHGQDRPTAEIHGITKGAL
jgi:hypothetical protein